MDRMESISLLMRRVHSAAMATRYRSDTRRRYYSVLLHVPGFATDMQVEGVDVKDLMVPDVDIKEEFKPDVLCDVLGVIGAPNLLAPARKALRTMMGRLVLDFALVASTAEERYARLLWAFGKHDEKEVGENTLIIKGALGDYGVRDGVIVGGPFQGAPFSIPTAPFLEKVRRVTLRSPRVTELRHVLHARQDTAVFNDFCLLYSLAEWDSRVILYSLLMTGLKTKTTSDLNKMASRIMESKDPYRTLFQDMVPYVMSYTDFVMIFGKPQEQTAVRQSTRIKLVNKLYMLPFFG